MLMNFLCVARLVTQWPNFTFHLLLILLIKFVVLIAQVALSNHLVAKKESSQLNNQFFSWAVSTVMTRQNTIPSKDGTQLINALIPLWDLCNHTNGTVNRSSASYFTETLNFQNSRFQLITIRN